MKLLVFSDSHGNKRHMVEWVAIEQPDGIVHLGDVAGDADALAEVYPDIPLHRVRGNCDGWSCWPEEAVVTLEGKKLLLMHGHTRGVKSGVSTAVFAAKEMGAQVLLYGHTHRAHCELNHNLWILNPGSAGSCVGGTYGVITIEGETVTCNIKKVCNSEEQKNATGH